MTLPTEQRRISSLPGEFELIARYFAPLAEKSSGAMGLLDDAARYAPRPGSECVLTADMIVEGVHFRPVDRPADIGFKALAVNVSDLVAKGARPEAYLLSLALSGDTDEKWVAGLAKGLREGQEAFGCLLFGGDTARTPGPTTISVTALGRVKKGKMLLRSGARPGDKVYVTGTIGDGAAGLLLGDSRDGARLPRSSRSFLASRYLRPRPRMELLSALAANASGAMDISDGLVGDFRKMCSASRTGGVIRLSGVPLSPAVRTALAQGFITLDQLVTGGDDYEVLAAIPARRAAKFEAAAAVAGVDVACIGDILRAAEGVSILGADGSPVTLASGSYTHF
ncbi:MAG: thiamine-phosphate kinase [Hyphomicrobiales bacterium]